MDILCFFINTKRIVTWVFQLKAASKIITKDFDRVREKTEIVPNPGKGLCRRKRRMRGIYRATY